jgi:APA family basic amino acid/polyamine antiporter
MPEQMAFARKASGLVRGLSLIDAFGVGFMNQGLTVSMWVMISMGLSVYTGGNLIIATLLSALLCGIGFSLVWGILGGSMPRSGGEYIYNSRIISPIIGIAESFGNAFVWIMWIFVLAPWTVDPGLVMLFQFLNMPAAAEFCTQGWAVFLFSTLVSLIALLFLVFGMKVFAMAQKIVMGLGTLGGLVILFLLTFTSHDAFVTAWNNVALQYGSLDYNSFLASAKLAMEAVGTALPTTWNCLIPWVLWWRVLGFLPTLIALHSSPVKSRDQTRRSSSGIYLPFWYQPSLWFGWPSYFTGQ